jgi:hypothetical protein
MEDLSSQKSIGTRIAPNIREKRTLIRIGMIGLWFYDEFRDHEVPICRDSIERGDEM